MSMELNDLLKQLSDTSGIEKARVGITVQVTVQRRTTGEEDKYYQPIRERVVAEEELQSLIEDTDWDYQGEIDVTDYDATDRFRRQLSYDFD